MMGHVYIAQCFKYAFHYESLCVCTLPLFDCFFYSDSKSNREGLN